MLSIWDPFVEFHRVPRHSAGGAQAPASFTPVVDVEETEAGFVLFVELPGMKLDDVHVEVHDDVLTLKGERKSESDAPAGDRRYSRRERHYGPFLRRFHLPEQVEAASIEATLRDGVLKLVVPKKPAVVPRRIPIQH